MAVVPILAMGGEDDLPSSLQAPTAKLERTASRRSPRYEGEESEFSISEKITKKLKRY
jgi:hypothetical protein